LALSGDDVRNRRELEPARPRTGATSNRQRKGSTVHYRIADDVISHAVSGEVVILDLRSGDYLGIDEIGSELWRMLADGLALAAIKERLAADYGENPDVVARDVDEFMAELQAAGLVEELGSDVRTRPGQ
jgi:Coenzyme PQQ synthesis protein D (PqqD)